jgi:DNA primase
LSGLYADDILDEVARANDIVEVIASYFPLKRAGKDYKALCPFHPEKTPSFTVSRSKQIFKCFGCGRGGSVFNFVMLRENVTFPEAVRILAERAGITLRQQAGHGKPPGPGRDVRNALEWATAFFEGNLRHPTLGEPARNYLAGRGFTKQSVEAFHVGFAPGGWDGLVKAAQGENIPVRLLELAGLVVQRDDGSGCYDRFRGRVMFPITDALSRPIGFGGRCLGDETPKYLNSPETALFHKAENLYGLPQARARVEQTRRAVVVEGYTDVVMAHQVGERNVIATLGTALTGEHVRILRRYADEVVLVFDSDEAGRRAADRGLELFLAEDVRVYVTALPEGKDPFDVCRDEGAEAFERCLAGAKDALEYKWELVRREFDAASSPAAQRRALDAMLTTLAQAPVFAGEEANVRRDLLLGRIGQALGIRSESLWAELRKTRRRARRADDAAPAETPPAAARGRRWIAERELLTALVCRPTQADEVAGRLPPEKIEDAAFRRLYEATLARSNRRDRDIQGVLRGIEDAELASLAVDLYDRGEAIEACRKETDTGGGPLARLLDETLGALEELAAEEELAARGRVATEGGGDAQAFRDFAEARKKRKGFLPPAAKR